MLMHASLSIMEFVIRSVSCTECPTDMWSGNTLQNQKSFSNGKKKIAPCLHHPLAITVLHIVKSPFFHGVEIGSKCLSGGVGAMVQIFFCSLRFKITCCLILLNFKVPSERSWNKVLK